MNLGAASAAERGELLPSRGSFSGGGGSSAPLAPPGGRGAAGSRGHSCLLQVCRAFNFLTALCALLCALAFGMAIVVRGEATSKVGGEGEGRVRVGRPCTSLLDPCQLDSRCLPATAATQQPLPGGSLTGPSHQSHTLLPSYRPPHRQDAYFVSGQAVRAFGIGIALLIVMVRGEPRGARQQGPPVCSRGTVLGCEEA